MGDRSWNTYLVNLINIWQSADTYVLEHQSTVSTATGHVGSMSLRVRGNLSCMIRADSDPTLYRFRADAVLHAEVAYMYMLNVL